ncbi:MAG: DNA repair protein RadC [Lachnospiraceae bacterium]|nr:DNA repair protein RadC [Lachnospiraceae bacterium]
MHSKKMKDKPLDERPYEKCLHHGAGHLSDAELLAVIIRSGSRDESAVELAGRILYHSGAANGLLSLHHVSLPELQRIPGIGKVKAVQLKCVAELSRRMAKASSAGTTAFTDPKQIADFFMEDMRHKEREELRVVFFNTKNQYIHDIILFQGTVNSSVVSPREIFLEALRYQAVSIVLLHNHPSGDCTPSREDILTTRRIRGAGDLIGISLIDHIIIGDHSYISLKERGVL